MSKQDFCDIVAQILGLEIIKLGKGSSVEKEWLKLVFDKLNSNVGRETKGTKHSLFEGTLILLGADSSTEFFEEGKSEGSTVTAEGMEKVATLLQAWQQLASVLGIDEFVLPRELTEKLIRNNLLQWVNDAGYETAGYAEHDFWQLKPELEAYSCVNEHDIFSIEYVQFCISHIESSNSEDREDDVESKIGDSSEDKPGSVALTNVIDAHLEMPNVETMLNQIDRGVLKLDPPWQRKVVWAEKKQRQLLKSVMLKLPLPSFILFQLPDSSHREVVDGKQRLTSLYNFYKGRLKFPKILIADDKNMGAFTLRDCSEKMFDELPSEAQERVRNLTVHTSTLRNINPQTIYEIFTIYNSSGTRLNAVEIRNAAFQDHSVHKEMVELTGEQEKESEWNAYTENLRYIIGNGKTNANRYKYLAFVERYLGYSRAYNEHGKPGFKRLTTTKSIKAFYDTEDANDDANAKAIVTEFKANFDFCLDNLTSPFHFVGKFHALKATNSLILVNLISNLVDDKSIDLSDAVDLLNQVCSADPPANQNTSTIWTYHIDSVSLLWSSLDKKQKESLDSHNADYLGKLLPLRNETGD